MLALIRLITTVALFALVAPGCELNQGPGDASAAVEPEAEDTEAEDTEAADTTDDVPEDTTPDLIGSFEPQSGCKWADGDWDLLDCQGAMIFVSFSTLADCTLQVVSNSPVFSGSTGTITNNAFRLYLPATAGLCHGFYDGHTLYGACDVSGGACSFVAQKQ